MRTAMKHHLTPVRMACIKKFLKQSELVRDVVQKETSFTIGGGTAVTLSLYRNSTDSPQLQTKLPDQRDSSAGESSSFICKRPRSDPWHTVTRAMLDVASPFKKIGEMKIAIGRVRVDENHGFLMIHSGG